MRATPLVCIAAAALALLPLAASTAADPGKPPQEPPYCYPAAQAPLPPGPLVGHRVQAGFSLSWDDPLNLFFDIAVDHYEIFRIGISPLDPNPAFVGEVPSGVHEFVDQRVPPGEVAYWVVAHNCQGQSSASNPVSSTVPVCSGNDLKVGVLPLTYAWVDTSCTTGGNPCHVTLQTQRPPYIYTVGCAVGS